MTKYSMQAEPKRQLNRLQREVLDALCISKSRDQTQPCIDQMRI